MADVKEKLCPFRVFREKTHFKYSQGEATTEKFYDCLGEKCAAYYKGGCLRLVPPALLIDDGIMSLADAEKLQEEMRNALAVPVPNGGGAVVMKCDPMAYAKCPTREVCGPCAADCEYREGSDCDKFNQQVLSHPMTNADRIRAMSDEELAKAIATLIEKNECFREDCGDCTKCPLFVFCSKCEPGFELEWLQQPAEEG